MSRGKRVISQPCEGDCLIRSVDSWQFSWKRINKRPPIPNEAIAVIKAQLSQPQFPRSLLLPHITPKSDYASYQVKTTSDYYTNTHSDSSCSGDRRILAKKRAKMQVNGCSYMNALEKKSDTSAISLSSGGEDCEEEEEGVLLSGGENGKWMRKCTPSLLNETEKGEKNAEELEFSIREEFVDRSNLLTTLQNGMLTKGEEEEKSIHLLKKLDSMPKLLEEEEEDDELEEEASVMITLEKMDSIMPPLQNGTSKEEEEEEEASVCIFEKMADSMPKLLEENGEEKEKEAVVEAMEEINPIVSTLRNGLVVVGETVKEEAVDEENFMPALLNGMDEEEEEGSLLLQCEEEEEQEEQEEGSLLLQCEVEGHQEGSLLLQCEEEKEKVLNKRKTWLQRLKELNIEEEGNDIHTRLEKNCDQLKLKEKEGISVTKKRSIDEFEQKLAHAPSIKENGSMHLPTSTLNPELRDQIHSQSVARFTCTPIHAPTKVIHSKSRIAAVFNSLSTTCDNSVHNVNPSATKSGISVTGYSQPVCDSTLTTPGCGARTSQISSPKSTVLSASPILHHSSEQQTVHVLQEQIKPIKRKIAGMERELSELHSSSEEVFPPWDEERLATLNQFIQLKIKAGVKARVIKDRSVAVSKHKEVPLSEEANVRLQYSKQQTEERALRTLLQLYYN